MKVTKLSGFPEYLPAERIVEQHFLDVIRETFELHGFSSLETRAVEPVERLLGGHDRITLVPPLPFPQMVAHLCRAHLILSDSGGLQEEAAALGVPLLLLRDNSERPEAIAAGKLDAKAAIDADALIAAGIIRRKLDGVKLLGKGELSTKLNLTVYSATATARAAVEKAGGSLTTTKKEAPAAEAEA